uniref:LRRCT domain-containing protein n=1 Tax=Gouania willdenowi TaxID=441366 RepID=A0A8C5E9T0_GOUWI
LKGRCALLTMRLWLLVTLAALVECSIQQTDVPSCPHLCSCLPLPVGVEVSCSHFSLSESFPPNTTRLSIQSTIFQSLEHLELLLINKNQLQSLPTGLFDGMKSSFRTVLSGNSWKCDREMTYVWTWLNAHPGNVFFLEEVTCDSPETLKHKPVVSLNVSQLACSFSTVQSTFSNAENKFTHYCKTFTKGQINKYGNIIVNLFLLIMYVCFQNCKFVVAFVKVQK